MEWDLQFFEPKEVLSPDGLALLDRGILPISFQALRQLERFRALVGRPLRCNHGNQRLRGFRSMRECAKLYGEDRLFSFHLWCAFDLSSDYIAPDVLFKKAVRSGLFGGIGSYGWGVHVDCRDRGKDGPITWHS